MTNRQPTLLEVLHPNCFKEHPLRARVTRTVRQPDIDKFEEMEAQNQTKRRAVPQRATQRDVALAA